MPPEAKCRSGDQTDAQDACREPHPQNAILVVVSDDEVVTVVRSATSSIGHLYDFRASAGYRLLELSKVRWVREWSTIIFLLNDGDNLLDDLAALGRVTDNGSELMLQFTGDFSAAISLVKG